MRLYGSTNELELGNKKLISSCDDSNNNNNDDNNNVNLISDTHANEMHKLSAASEMVEQTSSAKNVNRAPYSRCMSSLSEVK